MPTFIELSLSNNTHLHVEVTGDPRTAVEQLARSGKRSWIETVEGFWVNLDHVVAAALVELPHAPSRPAE